MLPACHRHRSYVTLCEASFVAHSGHFPVLHPRLDCCPPPRIAVRTIYIGTLRYRYIYMPSTHPGPCSSAPEAALLQAQQSVAGSAVRLSGACHALLLQKCLVGIACYGSSAVSTAERAVRATHCQPAWERPDGIASAESLPARCC